MLFGQRLPVPRQQLVPAGGGPVGGDLADDVGDIGLRLEAVHRKRVLKAADQAA